MGQCEVCGDEYAKAFEVVAAGSRHVFDSFECAMLRPLRSRAGVEGLHDRGARAA
jgi:hypothetical protein